MRNLSKSRKTIGKLSSEAIRSHFPLKTALYAIRIPISLLRTFNVEPDRDCAHVRVVGLADVDAGVLVAHLRYVEAPHAVAVAHLQWVT